MSRKTIKKSEAIFFVYVLMQEACSKRQNMQELSQLCVANPVMKEINAELDIDA